MLYKVTRDYTSYCTRLYKLIYESIQNYYVIQDYTRLYKILQMNYTRNKSYINIIQINLAAIYKSRFRQQAVCRQTRIPGKHTVIDKIAFF